MPAPPRANPMMASVENRRFRLESGRGEQSKIMTISVTEENKNVKYVTYLGLTKSLLSLHTESQLASPFTVQKVPAGAEEHSKPSEL